MTRNIVVMTGFVLAAGLMSTGQAKPDDASLPSAETVTAPPTLPNGDSDNWSATVQKDIANRGYFIAWQEDTALPKNQPAYQAPNRAHNLRTYFTNDGIRVYPLDNTDWQWGLSFKGLEFRGYGNQEKLRSPRQAKLNVTDNRIEYRRGNITEWYVNSRDGLEQGFILHKAPKDISADTVTFLLDIKGDLVPTLNQETQTVHFQSEGGVRVLDFGKLISIDADGKTLASHFILNDRQLAMVVDTTDARYPILVDPLLIAPLLVDPAWIVPPLNLSISQTGTGENENFGTRVASAGDVNSDGFTDVIVTNGIGKVFVYFGRVTDFGTSPPTVGLDILPEWTAEVVTGGFPTSVSAATAGDVNGDGFSDIIVGFPGYNPDNAVGFNGRVYIWFGGPRTIDHPGLGAFGTPTNADIILEPEAGSGNFGYFVGSAGDLNGDGFGDVIVSDPRFATCCVFDPDTGEFIFAPVEIGQVYIYYGSSQGGLSLSEQVGPSRGEIFLGDPESRFGDSVAMGDVNGDGFSDLVVGDPNRVIVEICMGAQFGFQCDGSNSISLVRANSVALGDVNNDGFSDIIIGNQTFPALGGSRGDIFVFHGSAAGIGYVNVSDADFVFEGEFKDEFDPDWAGDGPNGGGPRGGYQESLGRVMAVDDVNIDGFSDVIAGAPTWKPNRGGTLSTLPTYGRAYLFLGSPLGLVVPPNSAIELPTAPPTDFICSYGIRSCFGAAVATADLNGDVYPDVLIGGPDISGPLQGPRETELVGAAFAYYGDEGDDDDDGVGNNSDNCVFVFNQNQLDTDGDEVGDVCDNSPNIFNPDQADDDDDEVGNVSDNCPFVSNSGQEDLDGDGIGDACDADIDNDGLLNGPDVCPLIANPAQIDTDGDGIGDLCNQDIDGDRDEYADTLDNCPNNFNPLQLDDDNDGVGNVCQRDLFVGPFEITQGIQNVHNTVRLIRGKTTFLRVKVGIRDTTFDVPGVTARVTAFLDGGGKVVLTPQPRVITAPNNPERRNWQDTLNFILPESLILSQSNTMLFTIEVNPDRTIVETDYTNNALQAGSGLFFAMPPLNLVMVPVLPFDGFALCTAPTWREMGETMRWLYKTYPISRIQREIIGTLNFAADPTDTTAGVPVKGLRLLSALYRTKLFRGERYPNSKYYGLVCAELNPPLSRDIGGMGTGRGDVAFGIRRHDGRARPRAPDTLGGALMAQEIAHTILSGVVLPPHAPGCLSTSPHFDDYPNTSGRIDDIGFWWEPPDDPIVYDPNPPGSVKADRVFDYMSYCSPAWTSKYVYDKLFHKLR